MGELDNKVAVITGAGSGMAKASVRVFIREGAKVVAGRGSRARAGQRDLPGQQHRQLVRGGHDLQRHPGGRRVAGPGRGRGRRGRHRREGPCVAMRKTE